MLEVGCITQFDKAYFAAISVSSLNASAKMLNLLGKKSNGVLSMPAKDKDRENI